MLGNMECGENIMKFNCIFCGKEVEQDAVKANGFCDGCNLAYECAQITLKELRKVGIK